MLKHIVPSKIEKSEIDNSINYILEFGKSVLECRFVQRDSNQIIVYVSSHNGCSMACRFCHLTQSGQTTMEEATPELIGDQLHLVLSENHEKIHSDVKLNVNFMARGEPLENKYIVNNWSIISLLLLEIAKKFQIKSENVKFNISTIIPKSLNKNAAEIFWDDKNTWLYWSYYSHQMAFRRRWMPKAKTVEGCLEFIGEYPRVVVHGAFIKNENDQIKNLKKMLIDHPQWKMNIVRYNPYSDKQGEEATNIDEIFKELSPFTNTQIIPRVGPDVHASCGMFIENTK